MLTDRYGLPLSTTSTGARDDYVLATDRALTFYPGAAEAYDRAIAAEPGFALAHAGKAQVLMPTPVDLVSLPFLLVSAENKPRFKTRDRFTSAYSNARRAIPKRND